MHLFDETQDALDAWDTDETQWILTDGAEYAVCTEDEASALMTSGWELTSPEELAKDINNSEGADMNKYTDPDIDQLAEQWAADEDAERVYRELEDHDQYMAEQEANSRAAEQWYAESDKHQSVKTDLF